MRVMDVKIAMSCRFAVILCCLLLTVVPVHAAQNLGDFTTVPGDNDHPHNFSQQSGAAIHSAASTEDRICIFCHTPHSSSSKGALWNRQDPVGPNGDGTFPLYGELSGRLGDIEIDTIVDAQYGGADYPNGASRLCLSCHDGVTAIGEVINPSGGATPLGGLGTISEENPATTAVIDLDLSHPISFVYTETVRAAIVAQKQAGSLPGIVDSDYTLPGAGHPKMLDSSDRMQCTSCHDPHLDTNDGGYTLPMWRQYAGYGADSNADYEATCQACHADFTAIGGSDGLNRNPASGDNH